MQESHRNRVTLVLGGARSGKSRYALQLAAGARAVVFVATAQARDEEMRLKIERHRQERPAHWSTVEEPLQLPAAIARQGEQELVIVDCLTLYASNLMEACGEDTAAIEHGIAELCAAVEQARCRLVLVSNEVGSGIVPAYAMGRQFREVLGAINQRIAARADHVVLMVAGLPLALKGAVDVAGAGPEAAQP